MGGGGGSGGCGCRGDIRAVRRDTTPADSSVIVLLLLLLLPVEDGVFSILI
jgi:hypothetical protein